MHHILHLLIVLTGAKGTSMGEESKVLSKGVGRWISWPRLMEYLATLLRG
jgi:hypothetical protein